MNAAVVDAAVGAAVVNAAVVDAAVADAAVVAVAVVNAAVVDAAVDVGAAVAGAKVVVCEATLARSAPYIIRKNRNTRYMFRRRLMEQLLLCNLSKIRKRVHIHLIYLYDSDLLIINLLRITLKCL